MTALLLLVAILPPGPRVAIRITGINVKVRGI